MKKIVVSLMSLFSLFAVEASVLPQVGNSTSPNVWTKNVTGVFAAAKQTRYPILLAVINDTDAGVGCSHCMLFLERTVYSDEFKALQKKYKFYMVLLNYQQGAQGYVSNATATTYSNRYGHNGLLDILPDVAIIDPDGKKVKGFGYPTTDNNFSSKIEEQLRKFVAKYSTYSLQGGPSVVTVREGEQAVWNGSVTRSGGSGLAGVAVVTLAGANSGRYALNPSILNWGVGDGAAGFSVVGSSSGNELVLDALTVAFTASTPGASVAYGTQSQSVVFKDARIAQTLEEFKASRPGLEGLTSSDIWYKPTSAAGDLLCNSLSKDTSSVLTLTATAGGVMSLSALLPMQEVGEEPKLEPQGSVVVAVPGEEPFELTDTETTIGVAPGDVVTITATASADLAEGVLGLKKVDFTPLTLNLSTPANGTVIQWSDFNPADPGTKDDLAWTVSDQSAACFVYRATPGSSVPGAALPSDGDGDYEGDGRADGVDIGLIATDHAQGDTYWGVCATLDNPAVVAHGVAKSWKISGFTVNDKPALVGCAASYSAYLKVGASIAFSATGAGPISFSASGLPSGMSMSGGGVISGTPRKAGSYSVTVTAANAYGACSQVVTMTVGKKFPEQFKGNYTGVFFDGAQRPQARMDWKISSAGKWTASIERNGSKTKLKGVVVIDNVGNPVLSASGMAVGKTGSALWLGSWQGMTLLGRAFDKKSLAGWSGVWNAGCVSGGKGGYVKAKLSSGKSSFSGKISGKDKFAGKGQLLLLDAGTVATYLPAWSRGCPVAFVQSWKKTSGKIFNGGFAYYSDGVLLGYFEHAGLAYDLNQIMGSIWRKSNFQSLSGQPLLVDGAGIVSLVSAGAKKLSVPKNAFSASLSANNGTGTFKGAYKMGGGSYKYEGAFFLWNGRLVGLGGGSSGSGVFSRVELGSVL